MKVFFVTGNQEKIAIAKAALVGSNIEIEGIKIDCPELQDDDSGIIAKYSAKFASELIKCSIIKVDSGLYIEALDGFPGPYSEYVERKLDAQDIINMMKGRKNRNAYYKEVLAYCEYGKDPITLTTFTYGKISENIDGDKGYNFDRIFICEGDKKTIANFEQEERVKRYSHENWKKIRDYIQKNMQVK